jgi:hypothetical protein
MRAEGRHAARSDRAWKEWIVPCLINCNSYPGASFDNISSLQAAFARQRPAARGSGEIDPTFSSLPEAAGYTSGGWRARALSLTKYLKLIEYWARVFIIHSLKEEGHKERLSLRIAHLAVFMKMYVAELTFRGNTVASYSKTTYQEVSFLQHAHQMKCGKER